jgi:S1-C subfamily serine protease
MKIKLPIFTILNLALCALILCGCGTLKSRPISYDSSQPQSNKSSAPVAPYPVSPWAEQSSAAKDLIDRRRNDGATAKSKRDPIRADDLKEYAGISVALDDLLPSPGGPVVSSVPATGHTTSQLLRNDVILSLGGTETKTACELYRRLRSLPPRTLASIEIRRNNKLMRGTILLSTETRVVGCEQ